MQIQTQTQAPNAESTDLTLQHLPEIVREYLFCIDIAIFINKDTTDDTVSSTVYKNQYVG